VADRPPPEPPRGQVVANFGSLPLRIGDPGLWPI